MPSILPLAVGLLPVIGFLLALIGLDSYKLVSLRRVAGWLALGALAAAACLPLNRALRDLLDLDLASLARYVAPPVEELLKGAAVALVLLRRRVGFLVDASILGFAVGAGFATLENLYFALALETPRLGVWLVRGLGTAVMHGGATACLAVLAKTLADRHGRTTLLVFVPGWLLAVLLHSAFNHFFLAPDLSTLALLTVLPLVFVAVFRVSEERTREWLGTGFDTDAERLEDDALRRGEQQPGRGLPRVAARATAAGDGRRHAMPPGLRLELSIAAKGRLLLKEAGIAPAVDPEVRAKFEELEFLEREIGTTGLAALHPILSISDRDLWQHHILGGR